MPASSDTDSDDPLAAQRVRWLELVGDDTVLSALVRRHRERHRRYHTLDHVLAVVGLVEELADVEDVQDVGAVVAAAWYHDAVYEPRSHANERASARLARRDLATLGWDPTRVETVATMIEGTAHHTDPGDVGTAVLYDADLAILGAPPDEYADYVTKVRTEYGHVDDDAWRAGRTEVLGAILGRARIFATSTGLERWEAGARINVQAELDGLER